MNEMTIEDYKKGLALSDKFLAQLEGVGKMEALVAFAACLGMVASQIGTGPRAPTVLLEKFYAQFDAAAKQS